jgi:23S rRNA (pseudouridine1915-N3)-methyltransferase
MKIKILTIGTKMPSWVNEGVREYSKRLPKELSLDIVELPMAARTKNADITRLIQKEADAMLAHVQAQDYVVALEVNGKNWSTEKLAEHLQNWQMNGQNVVLLVGGPDGLGDACRQRANQLWSLSALTFPHPIVRVILAEQLYRAWTITQHHPYHRA